MEKNAFCDKKVHLAPQKCISRQKNALRDKGLDKNMGLEWYTGIVQGNTRVYCDCK